VRYYIRAHIIHSTRLTHILIMADILIGTKSKEQLFPQELFLVE
jgi:hypothetical protein